MHTPTHTHTINTYSHLVSADISLSQNSRGKHFPVQKGTFNLHAQGDGGIARTHVGTVAIMYMHIHAHTCTYMYIHVHTCTYMHIHVHTYMHIHVHTCTYMYIHAHTCTHTYYVYSDYTAERTLLGQSQKTSSVHCPYLPQLGTVAVVEATHLGPVHPLTNCFLITCFQPV